VNEYQKSDSLKEHEAIQKRNAAVVAHQDRYINELIAAAVLAEREACANVCDQLGWDMDGIDCARFIRARSDK